MRTAVAWLAGVLALLIVAVAVGMLGDAMGVPPAIYFDTPVGSEVDGEYTESDGGPTSFGHAVMLFSCVIALWVGRATFTRAWRAGFTPLGKITFQAWLIAAIALLPLGALFDLALVHRHGSVAFYVRLLLEVSIAGGVGWACHQWWKSRLSRAKGDE